MVSHHLKLLIATSPEKGGPQSEDRCCAQIGKALDHQTRSCHLLQPHVVATLRPILGIWLVCHGEHPDLVPLLVKPLHCRIVRELVRDKECGFGDAPVGVLPPLVEELAVDSLDQLLRDGSVEGEGDHHWNLLQLHASIWPPGLKHGLTKFFKI